jgi:2-methylisocitrate lyase-like PEP mutase family enzyme
MTAGNELRGLLQRPGLIVAPGAYDCITARAVERSHFAAVYMSGSATAAGLGFPDYGLATMNELVENAGRIADAVRVPVIADADTGFGNELNVARAVRAYAKAGVAAIHLEDQAFPKRCGHLDNKQVIPTDDYIRKIRAAVGEKPDPAFVIIARTDARATNGLDDAINRVNRALQAGADVAFVEAPQTLDEVAAIPGRVEGPCLLNVVHRGKTPAVDLQQVGEWGYRIAIVPGLTLATVLESVQEALDALRETGRYPGNATDPSIRERFSRVGADEWDAIADRYADSVAKEGSPES